MALNLKAIALQRCPRCNRGQVFHGLASTNRACPVCGLIFERDTGYFTGAMYASYALGMVTSFPVWMTMLILGIDPFIIVGVAVAQILITLPLLFRYSRVIWLHFDNAINPFPPSPAE